MSAHKIVHVDFSSNDRVVSGNFYQELFDWKVKQIPEMDYATFESGDGSVGGGFNPINDDNPAGTVMVYIETDDINASLKQAETLGGTILSQPRHIPDVGLFAYIKDLSGNTLALLQPEMP